MRRLLVQGYEEDPEFRSTIDALSRRGMRIAGVLGFAVVLVFFLGHLIGGQRVSTVYSGTPALVVWDKLFIQLACLGLFLLSFSQTGVRWGRFFGGVVVVLIVTASLLDDLLNGDVRFAVGWIALAMLVAIGTLPFRPMQILSIAAATLGAVFCCTHFVGAWLGQRTVFDWRQGIQVVILAVLCVQVSILLYNLRFKEHKALQRARKLAARLWHTQVQISKYLDAHVVQKIFSGEFTASLTSHRARLTMFFSDIKDFTSYTDATDPDDVAKTLNEYLGEMAVIVRRWGGTIPQFTGDAVYALFGAPDSRGERDDALACVCMAIDMQRRMMVLRKKWWSSGIQFPFQIRCGINTGMANVGNYGSEGFMEFSAIGVNTNIASRLEQKCEPNEVYISHSTWGLVSEQIPCEPIGMVEVKGIHTPVQTYRVELAKVKISEFSRLKVRDGVGLRV